MSTFTIVSHNLQRDLAPAKIHADLERTTNASIRVFQEASNQRVRDVLVEHAVRSGRAGLHPQTPIRSPLAIDWDPTKVTPLDDWRLVPLHEDMPNNDAPGFDSRFLLRSGFLVGRWRLGVIDVHCTNGYAKPEEGRGGTPWGKRGDQWKNWAAAQYWLGTLAHVARLVRSETYDAVVVAGDFNARLSNLTHWYYPGRLLSGLFAFDGGNGIDRIIHSADSPLRQTDRFGIPGHTNHPIQWASYRFTRQSIETSGHRS